MRFFRKSADQARMKANNCILVGSEMNFMAADDLRSTLTDLNKAYDLIEQLIIEVRRQNATTPKEF
jgi:hypothetical protein